jgi:hypothetical protein
MWPDQHLLLFVCGVVSIGSLAGAALVWWRA